MWKLLKNSWIEWCGDIPESWDVMPNKYIMYKKKDICQKYEWQDILSLSLKWVTIRNLDEGWKMPASFDGYQYIWPENLLMCLFDYDVTPRCIWIIKDKWVTSPAYSQFVMKNNNYSLYYYYYFLMIDNTKELLHLAKNLRHSFTEDQIWAIHSPVPPIEEQKKIAHYLDKKVWEIDSLYADIEKQIEKLEEYKLSIITEAVTRWLNRDIELKESWIKWIGLMPKSWKIIRLKYASWLKGRIWWQWLRADEFYEDKDLPYLITWTDFSLWYVNWDTCVHITEERYMQDLAIHVKENDLLITKDWTIWKVAVAKNCPEKTSLNSWVFIIRNTWKYKYHDRFMYYLLKSNQFLKWFDLSNAWNSTIKHLNQEKFYNFQFAYPPIDEQKAISEYLDEKCWEINLILSKKLKQLDILDQYKKSLIYEYVTGKKEVPSNY